MVDARKVFCVWCGCKEVKCGALRPWSGGDSDPLQLEVFGKEANVLRSVAGKWNGKMRNVHASRREG